MCSYFFVSNCSSSFNLIKNSVLCPTPEFLSSFYFGAHSGGLLGSGSSYEKLSFIRDSSSFNNTISSVSNFTINCFSDDFVPDTFFSKENSFSKFNIVNAKCRYFVMYKILVIFIVLGCLIVFGCCSCCGVGLYFCIKNIREKKKNNEEIDLMHHNDLDDPQYNNILNQLIYKK
eukprot:TRINITY_DN14018_c0_g1_i1.p1 TRINITY_DN14018_c0_g1~~TRINITY_DN14018_c0_g1_i1.p1  ORF type:complete len:174 (+),score=30.00 TRINITY_DN14018_c0_g1_i1:883-1404(+)